MRRVDPAFLCAASRRSTAPTNCVASPADLRAANAAGTAAGARVPALAAVRCAGVPATARQRGRRHHESFMMPSHQRAWIDAAIFHLIVIAKLPVRGLSKDHCMIWQGKAHDDLPDRGTPSHSRGDAAGADEILAARSLRTG